MRVFLLSLCIVVFAGCAAYCGHRLDRQYGAADQNRYAIPSAAIAEVDFQRDVKPILDSRCVVCHGCYDAPCQLKLTAWEGITRGASREVVYSTRLIAAQPTRLFMDADTNAAWRSKGFFPVLNERTPSAQANLDASVLYRMLALKRASELPTGAVLSEKEFDFSLDRTQFCPRIEDMDRFETQHPTWGMPYGLPALNEREHATLTRWIEAGAPDSDPTRLPNGYAERITAWEDFLNADSLKGQLMARYIYEHWFVAHLYFDDLPGNEYFELVRSATPPGEPLRLIATVRPYDDPGVARVYYRLRRVTETILSKTHMPYALNPARMQRIGNWFLDAHYEVSILPSYGAELSSNPFITFRELPAEARYRFMLDEARYTLMAFMKGPVCRGQVALNVINDHFWIVFVNPANEDSESEAFLAEALEKLHLPAEHESTARLLRFRSYAEVEENFLRAKAEYLDHRFGQRTPVGLESLWNGDGANSNAALTGFRHFDSASVVHGLVGEPQTVLLIGYPLLERIHYLLVAGFDVYGNIGHQLTTRLYMDFLRMEAEYNFLALLPRVARQQVHDQWYRDADPSHIEHLRNMAEYFDKETGIVFTTAEPLGELYANMKRYFAAVDSSAHDLAASELPAEAREPLYDLSTLRGAAASIMPESAFLTVREAGARDHHFTVLRHSSHLNVAVPFGEEKRRVPAEDRLQVLNGFIGAYPNAFYRINVSELREIELAVRSLSTEADYHKLVTRFGIRRTDSRFWEHSDALHQAYRAESPREAGLFDYSRFENR